MTHFHVLPIGTILNHDEEVFIKVEPTFRPALQALEGFSHLNVLWWFSDFDLPELRNVVEVPKPYKNAPDVMGIFATRSPIRPNPIALTVVNILNMDVQHGLIQISYIDAHDGSPVLDLKPYTPSADRVEDPTVPEWCRYWPSSLEASEEFDWEKEFLF